MRKLVCARSFETGVHGLHHPPNMGAVHGGIPTPHWDAAFSVSPWSSPQPHDALVLSTSSGARAVGARASAYRRGMPQPFVVTPRAGTPAALGSVPSARPHARDAVRADAVLPDPLRQHVRDPEVTDLFVNGARGLFVDRGGGAERVSGWGAGEEEVRDLAVALIALGGRHIDDATPCIDVRLTGGIRVHAVLPPVCADGTTISVRIPRRDVADLADLERQGSVGPAGRDRLTQLIAARENLLITGAGGSGKTTLLGCLLATAAPTERIVTIEDVAELRIDHPHHVRLEARQPNLEGAGGVGMAQLVREALRMRPDRLVVGECRGPEVRELLAALNTGHDGGAGTLHANGLDDVPARLEALGALAGLDDRALARQVASAIGWVVHLARGADGVRRVTGLGRPLIRDDRLTLEAVSWPG